MKNLFIIFIIFGIFGCSTTPEPFTLNEAVPAPRGWLQMQKRCNIEGVGCPIDLLTRLINIREEVFSRFIEIDDLSQYGEKDYWARPIESMNRKGKITGDCEEFALAAQALCKARGIENSRIVFCLTERGIAHIVLEVEGWIIDNRVPVVERGYLNYTWLGILDYDGKWKRIS